MNYEKDKWELDNFADLKTQVYKVALFYTKNHDNAEDIVQETFLKALISMRSIREESKFKQWLLIVAKEKLLIIFEDKVILGIFRKSVQET